MQYRIEKAEINALPLINFNGLIEEVYDAKRLDEIVEYLKQHEELGFDTESRPAFKKGTSFPISVIQLATEKHAFLIRNQFTGITQSFSDFMSSEKYKKIGLALRDDIKKLHALGIENPKGLIDIARIAHQKGILQTGARTLAARYLKKRLSKTMQTSNWAEKELSDKQQRYAAIDAWVCLKLLPFLHADKTDYHALAEIYKKKQEALENDSSFK